MTKRCVNQLSFCRREITAFKETVEWSYVKFIKQLYWFSVQSLIRNVCLSVCLPSPPLSLGGSYHDPFYGGCRFGRSVWMGVSNGLLGLGLKKSWESLDQFCGSGRSVWTICALIAVPWGDFGCGRVWVGWVLAEASQKRLLAFFHQTCQSGGQQIA